MKGNKVLVVDDEANLTRSITFILRKEGYEVEVASNGEEAINKAVQLKPNVMLLDIMMPKKNGYEVCQEVREDPDLRDIYIIMLTAKGQEVDREKGLEMGADEFITKPFSPSVVVERVNAVLR